MLKIALFSDTFFPQVNGVAISIATTAATLSAMGHDVHVVTVSQASDVELDRFTARKYRTTILPSIPFPFYSGLRMKLPAAGEIYRADDWTPDIIHTHTPFGVGRAALQVARDLNIPVVGTHHTFFQDYLHCMGINHSTAKSLAKKSSVKYYNDCSLVITASESLVTELQDYGLKSRNRVIPNPVSSDYTTSYSDRKYPQVAQRSNDAFKLIYVGRVSREKNIDKIVKSMWHLVHKFKKNVRLTIVGDGPDLKCLQKLSTQLGLNEQISFSGKLNNTGVIGMLKSHDLFVTASESENMPISICEAMSLGLPIAAVPAKGIPEIVYNGINGTHFSTSDPQVMADQLAHLVSNPHLFNEYSLNSREMSRRFVRESVCTSLHSIYQECIVLHSSYQTECFAAL